MKKASLIILLFTVVSTIELFSSHEWHYHRIATYDAGGYYLYLPAVFIYKDLSKLRFYDRLDSQYQFADTRRYGIYDQKSTGNKLVKYPPGVAFGELPLFFVAHVICLITHTYPADGFSEPYQFCIAFSTLIWALLGLWFTAKLLRSFFSKNIVAITIFLLAFGTNIYTYTTGNTGMSHLLVFFQFAAFLYYSHKWLLTRSSAHFYLQCFLLGWIFITRPVDVLIVIVPLLWYSAELKSELSLKAFLNKQRKQLIIGGLSFIAVISILFTYWKITTGYFFHFSYEQEGFHFLRPHIIDGLFSYYRGWFMYTPLALIAIAGLLFFPPQLKKMRTAIFIYLCAIIYAAFSWYQWSYGWSFGCRVLIESFAVLSFPLAALLEKLSKVSVVGKVSAIVIGCSLVALNIFQTRQFNANVLPDGITKAYYWRVFLKPQASEEDRKLLRPILFRYP